jgi:hypothetical protein
MVVSHWVVISKHATARDNILLQGHASLGPEQLYTDLQCSYPKFYKMDKLSKWAWAGTEYLFSGNDILYKDIDKNKIAVVLATSYGCLDVDKRYYDTISVPSPALFVYTLPNIMMGEICIRHGFKGEQLCMVADNFDAGEMHFTVDDLLNNKGMEACLCGWVDAFEEEHDVCLFWVTKGGVGLNCTPAILQELYNWYQRAINR